MLIDRAFLVIGVVLLCFPAIIPGKQRKQIASSRRRVDPGFADMLPVWTNWFDLVRSFAGAYLLCNLAIDVDPTVRGSARTALLMKGAILGVGVLIQSFSWSRSLALIAPAFYLMGVALVVPTHTIGIFAVTVSIMFTLIGKSTQYLIPVLTVAIMASGFVLLGKDRMMILATCLALIPLGLAFVFQRSLIYIAAKN